VFEVSSFTNSSASTCSPRRPAARPSSIARSTLALLGRDAVVRASGAEVNLERHPVGQIHGLVDDDATV
jgi:hypothetical protein